MFVRSGVSFFQSPSSEVEMVSLIHSHVSLSAQNTLCCLRCSKWWILLVV